MHESLLLQTFQVWNLILLTHPLNRQSAPMLTATSAKSKMETTDSPVSPWRCLGNYRWVWQHQMWLLTETAFQPFGGEVHTPVELQKWFCRNLARVRSCKAEQGRNQAFSSFLVVAECKCDRPQEGLLPLAANLTDLACNRSISNFVLCSVDLHLAIKLITLIYLMGFIYL